MWTTLGLRIPLHDGASALLAWWRPKIASPSWAQLLWRDAPGNNANASRRQLEGAVEDAAAAVAVAEAASLEALAETSALENSLALAEATLALAHPEGSAPRPRIVVRLSVGLAELLGQDG